jgi:hypothetical protein
MNSLVSSFSRTLGGFKLEARATDRRVDRVLPSPGSDSVTDAADPLAAILVVGVLTKDPSATSIMSYNKEVYRVIKVLRPSFQVKTVSVTPVSSFFDWSMSCFQEHFSWLIHCI